MNDDPIKECEACGAPVRKLFNSTGIIFKGSGFYVNDYKGGKGKSETSPAASTGDKTPSKPEAAASTPAASEKA